MKIFVLLLLIGVIVGFSHLPSAAWSGHGRTKDRAPVGPDSVPA